MLNKRFAAVVLCLIMTSAARNAYGTVIDFEGFIGPSTFASAGPVQTLNIATPIGIVQITGGVILTNVTNVPANMATVYGTAGNAEHLSVFADPSLTNPIRITFPVTINTFFIDVINGITAPVNYMVADNVGNSQMLEVAPNFGGGIGLFGFATTGNIITVVAISGLPTFDFFIDNIHFNEPLPPSLIPEPGTAVLVAAGLAGLALYRKRLRYP
jgi:hypothetical protein